MQEGLIVCYEMKGKIATFISDKENISQDDVFIVLSENSEENWSFGRGKAQMLDSATELLDLRSPVGNRLEKLSGNRQGQHSIRINKQWRVCFDGPMNHAM